jgi:hypothetical protein
MPQVNVNVLGQDKQRSAQIKNVNVFPNECPTCHLTITPEVFVQGFASGDWLELYFRCPSTECSHAFVAFYEFDRGVSQGGPIPHFNFKAAAPVVPVRKAVSQEIASISPSFVRIFSQAQAAEDHGLDEVAGPGFRKALEFLVKDFAISLSMAPEETAEIKRMPLQAVISRYLNAAKLHKVSSRAAWLGNDESHYERKWANKDLSDLKRLIALVEHFISAEAIVSALDADMPDPKGPPKP